ncbi:MAG: hypothetical protein OXR82_06875 [Gammaproteobacteria bacterium]|nr:hypothetical protein [Gammaproteobacteria bacterium]MDE0258097.1 hypothetical protein [Gammaproteobacteria bacterium]
MKREAEPIGRHGHRVLTALFLISAAACGGDGQQSDTSSTVVRDSAGIEIVESARPLWSNSDGWRVESAPVLDLPASGSGPNHEFFQVRGMRRLSDGSLAVANGGSNEVRIYSADGNHTASLGGEGDGPSEFRAIVGFDNAGDSLIVLDANGRVTFFAPDRALLGTYSVPLPSGVIAESNAVVHLANGEIVIETRIRFMFGYEGESAMLRQPGGLFRVDAAGGTVDSIGVTAGNEVFMHRNSGGGAFAGIPLFGRDAFVATHAGRIFLGDAVDMRVEEVTADGGLARILRIPGYPLELSAAAFEREREARLAAPDELPPMIREFYQDLPVPDRRPAYADVKVDPTGAIWLRPFLAPNEGDGPETWQVLGPDGAWLGGVEIPADLSVMEVGMDFVLGVYRDELDVEHPRMLRLHRD